MEDQQLSILANNCFGQFMYKMIDHPYYSPTIDLLFHTDEYLKYLKSLKFDEPNVVIEESICNSIYGSSYYNDGLMPDDPYFRDWIAKINYTFEVSPIHYTNIVGLRDKWLRRAARLNPHNLLVTLNDAVILSGPTLLEFLNLDHIDMVKNFNRCTILYNCNGIHNSYIKMIKPDLLEIEETERTHIYQYKFRKNNLVVIYKDNKWRCEVGETHTVAKYYKDDFDLVRLFNLE